MYTLHQQVFTLSFLSNAADKQTGSVANLQAKAASVINEKLSNPAVVAQLGSSWQIVWGPIVFQEPASNVADNAMVVYRGTNAEGPVYVVGIAATNAGSQFDQDQEDRNVGSTVPFDGNGAWIAAGTSEGVQNLKAMTDPAGGSLQSFLESQAASKATLIFAGHSLGGALSPTLALDLVVNHGFARTKWQDVFVYPSAGPTPGNQAFRELFANTFVPQTAAEAWNAWNMDVVNSLDIVPRAWSQLPSLPTLYPYPAADAEVLVLVNTLIVEDELSTTNLYATLPTSSFTGQFNPSPPPVPGARLLPLPVYVPNYSDQAYYQHIAAYLETIVPELVPVLQ
jgi:Lipase (class 3)